MKRKLIFAFAIISLFLFGCISNDYLESELSEQIEINEKNYSIVSNPDGSFNCSGNKEQYCINQTLYYDIICEDGKREYGYTTCIYGCENSSCNEPYCLYAPLEKYCKGNIRFFNPKCNITEWIYESEECLYGCLNGDCLNKTCPENCDDLNPKTFDFCSNETGFECEYTLLEKNKQNYNWKYSGKKYSAYLEFEPYLLIKFKNNPRFTCYEPCSGNWEEEYYSQFIFNEDQYEITEELISQVEETNSDKKLKILIRFVQSIPYDWDGYYSNDDYQNFPYETLYYYAGVCSDKSLLGALIAKEMGYKTALFHYEAENHMALGIGCPKTLSNYNSGYCFIETTDECSRFTDTAGEYYGNMTLESTPKIYAISNGKSLSYDSVIEDKNEIENYHYALNQIIALEKEINETSDISLYNKYIEEYNEYAIIINKYCE